MAATSTPPCDTGTVAPAFSLPGVDGGIHELKGCRGPNGVVVMFLCNHCPYVQAALDRIVRDASDLAEIGVGSVAIMSNDTRRYPQDSLPRMQQLAREKSLPFPYLYDESQEVARAYGAVCTPDFFGFDADLRLRYRGRLDPGGRSPGGHDLRRELFEAMSAVARGDDPPKIQHPSIGCSIKWRPED